MSTPIKPTSPLPRNVRQVVAKAMGYNDEESLYYWGTGGAAKRFDDTCSALAELWPQELKGQEALTLPTAKA